MQRRFGSILLFFFCAVFEYGTAQVPFSEVVRTSAIVVSAFPITIEQHGAVGRALMEVQECYKGKSHIVFPFTIWVEWSLNADEQYISHAGGICILCLSGEKTDSVYHLSTCRYWQGTVIFPSAIIVNQANKETELLSEYRDSIIHPLLTVVPVGVRQDTLIRNVIRDVCPSSIQWPAEVVQLEIENKPSYYYRKKRYTVLSVEQLLVYIEKITEGKK